MQPAVTVFRHLPTGTFSYLVADPSSGHAAIIDPVLDYDPASGRTSTPFAAEIAAWVRDHGLTLDWILETHAHADHLSAASWLRSELGGRIAIGEGIRKVQNTFRALFNLKDLTPDGTQFDRLFEDGETFAIGALECLVTNTPGHTCDSVSYLIGDAAFVGDTLFAPDLGTARCDFPGGSARQLYRSIQRIFELPADTRVFLCHDYPPESRSAEHVHVLADHRQGNVHLKKGVDEDAYVTLREARDRTLDLPDLILPAVQVNIRAGRMPPPEDNGIAYLKIPLDQFGRPD